MQKAQALWQGFSELEDLIGHVDHVAIIVRDAASFGLPVIAVPSEEVNMVMQPSAPLGSKGRIELIEATNPQGSLKQFLDKRGESIHHVCFAVQNLRKAFRLAVAEEIGDPAKKAKISIDDLIAEDISNASELWDNLVQFGYIAADGAVKPAFYNVRDADKLRLETEFYIYEPNVFEILTHALPASRNDHEGDNALFIWNAHEKLLIEFVEYDSPVP